MSKEFSVAAMEEALKKMFEDEKKYTSAQLAAALGLGDDELQKAVRDQKIADTVLKNLNRRPQ